MYAYCLLENICQRNPVTEKCYANDDLSSCENLICGKNALCKFKKNTASCVCPDNFPLGDPVIECKLRTHF